MYEAGTTPWCVPIARILQEKYSSWWTRNGYCYVVAGTVCEFTPDEFYAAYVGDKMFSPQQNFFAHTGISSDENCCCNMSPPHVPAKCPPWFAIGQQRIIHGKSSRFSDWTVLVRDRPVDIFENETISSVELVKILLKNLANEIMCLHASKSLFVSCQGPAG